MTISARFVSRNASFPTKCVMPQRPDLGSLTPNTELATGTEKMQRRMRRYKLRRIGSHRRRHLCLPLTWCFGKCLTAVAARFVSRTASFTTTSGSPQRSDLAYLGQYAWGATGNENMQRGMRRLCRFSFAVSYRDRLTCGRASCLTSCHRRVVSYSCHFFRKNG